MAILGVLFMLLGVACGIGSLICFILVLVKMFQNNETTMGIVCIVTIFCGIGGLLAFILGWINAGKWKIQQIMVIWSGLFVASILLYAVMMVIGFAAAASSGAEFGPPNM
jgi:hypothetical protein